MFHLDIRQKFFTIRVINQWNNLPRDMVECLPLEVSKMQLGRVLDNLIEALFPTKGWIR